MVPGCDVMGDVDRVGGCAAQVCLSVDGYYWCVHCLRGGAGGVVAWGVSGGEDVWYVFLWAAVLSVWCVALAGVGLDVVV